MLRREPKQTLFVDDIDGSAAEGTVCSGLDGTQYEIDLNAEHARQLRDALASLHEGWAAGSRWPYFASKGLTGLVSHSSLTERAEPLSRGRLTAAS